MLAVINSATIVTPSREHGEFAYGYVVIQLPREEETRRVAVSFRVSLLHPSCPPGEPTRLGTDAGSGSSRNSQISVVCLQIDGGRGREDQGTSLENGRQGLQLQRRTRRCQRLHPMLTKSPIQL